jgi:hypothetical protein
MSSVDTVDTEVRGESPTNGQVSSPSEGKFTTLLRKSKEPTSEDGSGSPREPVGIGRNAKQRFRHWETWMRKRDLRESGKGPPPDLAQKYRFWETKLVRGELDSLFETAKQTWILDKYAAMPDQYNLRQSRTFWDVKIPSEFTPQARCASEPATKRRPRSKTPKSHNKEMMQDENSAVSTAASATPENKGHSPADHGAKKNPVLDKIFASYFAETVATAPPQPAARLAALSSKPSLEGSTLMVHDLLNKFTIDDVLAIFKDVGATDLEYVFLPLSTWDTKRQEMREKRKTRNKAYCFAHFSDATAADQFMQQLAAYEFPDQDQARETRQTRTKRMTATPASNQGVVPNLLRLVDLPNRKWHPRAGSLCVRVDGTMEHVGVLALREMLVERIGIPSAPGAQAPRPARG